MKPSAYFLIWLVSACAPLTPAEHVRNLKIETGIVRAGCIVYQGDAKYPRDAVVTARCQALTAQP